jgi:GTP-binding protein EngB required for normal cell division
VTGLADRLDALDEATALATDRLDPDVVQRAVRLAGKAGQRLRLGEGQTVVALAGATGGGKSSLFNALVGEPIADVGVRRPTTSTAMAAVWGNSDAGPLLDWLGVPRRHLLPADADGRGDLDGLVLLDLPDLDSVQVGHRLEVDRLVELVDLLIWVLDPQKYADAAVHERYLVPLADHAGVMLVVLNQADLLSPAQQEVCLADLRRLLEREGLARVALVPVSARTGEGLDELRSLLAKRVAAQRAAVERLSADLDSIAAELGRWCAGTNGAAARPAVRRKDRAALVEALAEASGADQVAAAVDRSHRDRARTATGWPFTRWVVRLRPDPFRRLRLPETPNESVRTSLPAPSPVQRARVDTALRTLADNATADLPEPWPALVRQATADLRDELPDQLDRAVAGADLRRGRQPRWWMVAGFLQAVLAVTAIAGGIWLAVLAALAYLRVPDPPVPHLGRLPVPTWLLVGGLLLGLLLAGASRRAAAIGGRRRARIARGRLRDRIVGLTDDVVLAPVERELAAHAALCATVARIRR